jgi:polar amino acid transport system substrate-binding protein
MVGTSAPNITALPLNEIEKGLESGTIDVGMCGLYVTEARLLRYDFTNPFYFATGLQAVIKLRALEPSAQFIVTQLVGCIDGKTLLILILLLISVIVFGHLMSITDCWLHDRPIFRKSYFETVQDGIWLSFIMLSTIGFGDIVPKSLGARVLAIIWMFISIGLMAIIYAIMTSNFGNMNLQMLGDLEQIQGIKDLAAFTVGSTISPTAPEFRSRFISNKFITYTSHEALFRALLKDEIQVVVERQEIVTYYNTMEPDFVSKMVTVGPVFNSDGVGFGVRRSSEVAPHPLLNLLSLGVADATRTNWQGEDVTRKRWFGEAVRVQVDPETLSAMSNGGYAAVLLVLEYVLAVAFGFWFIVSFIEFCWRYPKYKARNDVCAVVRDCLGMAPHGSLKDKMITASMRHDQVRGGEEGAGICVMVWAIGGEG